MLQKRCSGIGVKGMDAIIHHFYIYRNICVYPYEMYVVQTDGTTK